MENIFCARTFAAILDKVPNLHNRLSEMHVQPANVTVVLAK